MRFIIIHLALCTVVGILFTGCRLASDAGTEIVEVIPLSTVETTAETTPEVTEAALPTEEPESIILMTEEPVPASNTENTVSQSNQTVVNSAINVADCNPRTDWQTYTIQSGDTLSKIAANIQSTAVTIAQGNCLSNVNLISVGQRLYIPRLPDTASTTTTDSNQNTNTGTTAGTTTNSCMIHLTARTEVVNMPQGTGRLILGYLGAGTSIEPVVHFEGLPYYGIMFNDVVGWINARPVGDCDSIPDRMPDGVRAPENNCTFVGDVNAPLYYDTQGRENPNASIRPGNRYRFATFEGVWENGGERGNWIRIIYTVQPPQALFVQDSAGHLEGNCPGSPLPLNTNRASVYTPAATSNVPCMFESQFSVETYSAPDLNANPLRGVNPSNRYPFVAFAGAWQEDGESGQWLQITRDSPDGSASVYIQDKYGVLTGNCPAA